MTNLTTHAADDHSPTWSPDGSRIIFVSDRTGNPELQVMDADGSNVACLTNNLATDGSPDWCCPPPLLGQITYVTDRDGTGDDEIYVMSADGSNSTRLTNQSDVDFQPACSQDGNNILFSSHRDGNLELYLMSADGTNPTRLTNNAVPDTEPAWSPRGRIAFVFNSDEIYGMDPDGSNRVRLTNNTVLDYSPDWSPMISGDGMGLVFTSTDRIVFTSVRDGNAEVYVMSGDGNHQTRLTPNPPKDTDGRREDSGRGWVRELQGRWPGVLG